MGWIQKLYETYENCSGAIGAETDENRIPLLPICHTTQKAQVEIVIDGQGSFKGARVVRKEESRTIIPCTESSGGRTSGWVAHPLCDKLQYVAQDYAKYGGSKTPCFNLCVAELEKWCGSDYSHPKAEAVLKYVKKGRVVQDLIDHKILLAERDGKLLKKSDHKKEKEVLTIFDVVSSQEEAFVRWIVEIPGEHESKVWKDEVLWQKWIKHYSKTKEGKTLCFVTGEEDFSADQHPAKLRNDADKAKIIASGKSRGKDGKVRVDDGCGFTFLGRFINADEACGVGFKVTQKAHSALRWLIDRQGYKGKDGQAIVAWAISGVKIPKPTDDPLAILGFDDLSSDQSKTVSTAQDLALKLKKKIAGYHKELGDTTSVVVMGLDSATPGRMSITFYKELTSSNFLQRINSWHETCAWIHRYGYDKETKRHFTFVGAPAPVDIAEAAYGKKADDKIKKVTVARLLPCIIDGQPIPRDIVESAVRRACNRISMEEWEWNKTLGIVCALYKKYNTKEDFDMALDENRTTRDYLYGRLLAIADRLEEVALYKGEKDRPTHAARYMQIFSEHPNRTWKQIYLSLTPYLQMGEATFYKNKIDEVKWKFVSPEEFNLDTPLTGEFLLAYHCQRMKLRSFKGNKSKGKDKAQEQEQNEES